MNNGLHQPLGFWKTNAGSFISIAITIGTVLYAAGRVNERLETLGEWKKTIEQRIDRIDDTGTRAGQSWQKLVVAQNLGQDRRLTNMEDSVKQIVPDVREIKTKVEFIAGELGAEKKNH